MQQVKRKKVKQSLYRLPAGQRVPGGSESQISRQSAHEGGKVASPTHRSPLNPEYIPRAHFCYRLGRPQGNSAAGRIMQIKNSNDANGNRTRDLPDATDINMKSGENALPRRPSFSSLAHCTLLNFTTSSVDGRSPAPANR